MVSVKRRVKRSAYRNSFSRPKSRLRMGGPETILNPVLPKRPRGAAGVHSGFVAGHPGTAKAEASNSCLTPRPDERLPSPMRSGAPPMVPVPEGSEPEKDGVKYCPDWATAVQVVRHPPSICCTAAGALESNGWPFPKGRL